MKLEGHREKFLWKMKLEGHKNLGDFGEIAKITQRPTWLKITQNRLFSLQIFMAFQFQFLPEYHNHY